MNQNISQVDLKKDLKKSIIVILCVTAIPMLLCFGLFIFGTMMFIDDYNNNQYKQETLSLKNLSLTYDSKWLVDNSIEENNKKTIHNGIATINVVHERSQVYFNNDTFTEELKKQYALEEEIAENFSKININGLEWIRVVVAKDGYKALQLFFVKDYEIYGFSYVNYEQDFDSYINEVESIYKTLTIDLSQDKFDESEAKAFLIGEWDWGTNGYLVIDEDNYYLYKDSSKSMANVIYGTYQADNKIKTYAAGYKEGYSLLGSITDFVVDGESQASSSTSGIELVFEKSEEGYVITNINSQNSGLAIKKEVNIYSIV